MKKLYISSQRFGTGQVNVDGPDNTITFTPNLWRKFKGQPLGNLIRWIESHEKKRPRMEEI